MGDRFELGKVDDLDWATQVDFETINALTFPENQLYYNLLKRVSYEVFDNYDEGTRSNPITYPDNIAIFNPFDVDSFDSRTNIWVSFNSKTDADLVIAPDKIPMKDTYSVTQTNNDSYRANTSYYLNYTDGVSIKAGGVVNRRTYDDEPIYDSGVAIAFEKLGTYFSINDDFILYYNWNASIYNGGDIVDMEFITYGTQGTVQVTANNPSTTTGTGPGLITGGKGVVMQEYLWRARGAVTHDNSSTTSNSYCQHNWYCYSRNGTVAPTAYPSVIVRTLETADVTYKVTGTDMQKLYVYIKADTTSGTFTLSYYEPLTGTWLPLDLDKNVSDEYYYSVTTLAKMSEISVKIEMTGTAGTTVEINKFACMGIEDRDGDVWVRDGDVVDERGYPGHISIASQLLDLSKEKFLLEAYLSGYLINMRKKTVADQEDNSYGGEDLYVFSSFMIDETKILSNTLTYDATNDLYYNAAPVYSVTTVAPSGNICETEVCKDYDSGIFDDGTQGDVEPTSNGAYRHKLNPGSFEDDDKVNAIYYDNSSLPQDTSTYYLKVTNKYGNTDTDSLVNLDVERTLYPHTPSWTQTITEIDVPKYMVTYRGTLSVGGMQEVGVRPNLMLAIKTYPEQYIETNTFATKDNMIVGVLLDNTEYTAALKIEYWDGAAYQEMDAYTVVDTSALATTKLKISIESVASRKIPKITGFAAWNFDSEL